MVRTLAAAEGGWQRVRVLTRGHRAYRHGRSYTVATHSLEGPRQHQAECGGRASRPVVNSRPGRAGAGECG